MFTDFWKRKIINTEARVANIENNSLPIFVEHGTGAVYAQSVGVKVEMRREQRQPIFGGGGGGGYIGSLSIRMGRDSVSMDYSAPKQEYWYFHKDRVPQCDYVMVMLDGSLKFFKNQSPLEVDEKGKIIKAKKK